MLIKVEGVADILETARYDIICQLVQEGGQWRLDEEHAIRLYAIKFTKSK